MSTTQEVRTLPAGSDVWDFLYVSIVSLPTALLVGVLVSDGLYWSLPSAYFSEASIWLLGGVLATGVAAIADALLLYVSVGRIKPSKVCLMHVVGNLLALLLSLSNLIYRLNAGIGPAVVPAGISLTAAALCLMVGMARLAHGVAKQAAQDDPDDLELQ